MGIVIINFSLDGMDELDYRQMCDEVAPAFAAVPGLVSKVWLDDSTEGVYGGVYTFEDGPAVEAFVATDRFAEVGATPGLTRISVRRFGVPREPTPVTRGLVGEYT